MKTISEKNMKIGSEKNPIKKKNMKESTKSTGIKKAGGKNVGS